VLEPEESSRPTEAGLDLVEDEQCPMLPAPTGEGLDIRRRRETRAAPLERFEDDGGDAFWVDLLLLQGAAKEVEADVFRAEAVGERHLVHCRVEGADPPLERRDAADHLGAEGAAMKRALEAHDRKLLWAAALAAVGPRQLDSALGGFGPRGEEEHLCQRCRDDPGQVLYQRGAGGVWKTVRVEQPLLHLAADGIQDFRRAVAGVRDDHAGTPVQPHVPVRVVHLDAFGTMPHDGRLAGHRDGLAPLQGAQGLHGPGSGDGGDNAAETGVNRRDGLRGRIERPGHG